ncbi:MAG: hypothetical protein QM734_08325 [Cyclobacteriaceae bacterium]
MKFEVQSLKFKVGVSFSFFYFLLFFLISCSSLLAQDFKRDFKKAKELYNDGNYSSSMDAFKSLMVYDRNNPYPEYACFYYALSAHRLGIFSRGKRDVRANKKSLS